MKSDKLAPPYDMNIIKILASNLYAPHAIYHAWCPTKIETKKRLFFDVGFARVEKLGVYAKTLEMVKQYLPNVCFKIFILAFHVQGAYFSVK
jgi:hypothetical protein